MAADADQAPHELAAGVDIAAPSRARGLGIEVAQGLQQPVLDRVGAIDVDEWRDIVARQRFLSDRPLAAAVGPLTSNAPIKAR